MTAAQLVRVGSSDLAVFLLVLGGNVFGWTADETAALALTPDEVGLLSAAAA